MNAEIVLEDSTRTALGYVDSSGSHGLRIFRDISGNIVMP